MTDMANAPIWLANAYKERGVKELTGKNDGPTLRRYGADSKSGWTEGEAWCAVFVSAMLEESGVMSKRTAWARDYESYGTDVRKNPQPGDIVVFSRGPKYGHVTFFEKWGPNRETLQCFGGNQSDSVCSATFDASRILAIRRPPSSLNVNVPQPPAPPPVIATETPKETQGRLNDQGSRTIRHASWIQQLLALLGLSGGAVGAVNSLLSTVTPVLDAADNVKSTAQRIQEYANGAIAVWIVAAVIGGAFIMWAASKIVEARVDDERSGANSGRSEHADEN